MIVLLDWRDFAYSLLQSSTLVKAKSFEMAAREILLFTIPINDSLVHPQSSRSSNLSMTLVNLSHSIPFGPTTESFAIFKIFFWYSLEEFSSISLDPNLSEITFFIFSTKLEELSISSRTWWRQI